MNKTIFAETLDGLAIDRIIRDHNFAMTSRHFHESYELYFLLEGERYYFIEKETWLVRAGSVVLVNRRQIHKTSMAGSSYHDRILFQLDSSRFDAFLKKNLAFSLEDLFSGNYGVIEPSKKDWDSMKNLLELIQTELTEKKKNYRWMAFYSTVQLLLLLNRCSPSDRTKKSVDAPFSPRHEKVDQVAEYLLTHCETDESLEALASRFYVSKSYLCRIFKEITGLTVTEYININRVRKAQKLLVHSEYSITEISGIIGFESITYFERVFKKHCDTSPAKYRKAHKTV